MPLALTASPTSADACASRLLYMYDTIPSADGGAVRPDMCWTCKVERQRQQSGSSSEHQEVSPFTQWCIICVSDDQQRSCLIVCMRSVAAALSAARAAACFSRHLVHGQPRLSRQPPAFNISFSRSHFAAAAYARLWRFTAARAARAAALTAVPPPAAAVAGDGCRLRWMLMPGC